MSPACVTIRLRDDWPRLTWTRGILKHAVGCRADSSYEIFLSCTHGRLNLVLYYVLQQRDVSCDLIRDGMRAIGEIASSHRSSYINETTCHSSTLGGRDNIEINVENAT